MNFIFCSLFIVSFVGPPANAAGGDVSDFAPPNGLMQPMQTAYREINSAGPQTPYNRSSDSLRLPLLTINEALTDKIIDDIKEGTRYVMQTKNEFIIPVHGTGTTGAATTWDNMIESGDRVLIAHNGYWSDLMANMSSRLGAQVTRLNKAPGTIFTAREIENAIILNHPRILGIVQGESSTTVQQPLEAIGEICRRYNVLLIVDAVASAGIQPVYQDKNMIDVVYTSSGKGLGSIAGLALVSLSPRAVTKLRSRRTPTRGYQTDLLSQAQLYNTTDPSRVRFQSMSIPVLYALREALATIVNEGAANVFQRHVNTTNQLVRGLEALQLRHYVTNPQDRLIGITAVYPPAGKSAKKIQDYMFQRYNLEISAGFGPTAGQVLRIAAFSSNAYPDKIDNLLRILRLALASPDTNA